MQDDRRRKPRAIPLNAPDRIEILARLGDMAEVDYKNALGLAAIIDVLVTNGVATPADFTAAAGRLDQQLEREIGRRAHLRAVPARAHPGPQPPDNS